MMVKIVRLILLLMLSLVTFLTPVVYASEYSQPGFYDVHHYTLKNGLRVVLKPRHLARNVSIWLKVDVGHDHFSCGKRETAHFLEHLLFTGTSKHDENELDEIIESHGGSWNAETSSEYTIYKIDIYNKNLDVGINVLHEIITDSLITEDNVEKSRNIINREAGGKPSALRNWLHTKGIIASSTLLALQDLFPNTRRFCNAIDNSSSVTRDEMISTRDNYYIPNNMTLSIVGDFNLTSAKKLIDKTMGLMNKNNNTHRYIIPVPEKNKTLDTSKIYQGQFSPLLGTDATVYQFYRIPSKHHKDQYTFDVLEEYFNREMYQLLRVDKGLAYSPGAESYMYDKFGFFLLASDSEIDNIDENLELISQVIEKFKTGDLDENELKETKLKILLNSARGYETNEDFSEYYVKSYYEIKEHGALNNFEDGIEKVSLEDIQRVSLKYFNANNRVIAVSSPTLTYTQFYILILLMLTVISVLVWRIVLRVRRRKIGRK